MKSPFPGMDPFMELRWQHLHTSLTTYMCDQLQGQLPGDLLAQTNERVVMELAEEVGVREALGSARPDVGVLETTSGTGVTGLATIRRADAAPSGVLIQEFDYPETEPYIEIVDAQTRTRIITIIELISPTNKLPGKGRESYLAKQESTLRAKINLVEIDLTREGERAAIMPWCRELPLPSPAFLAGVRRQFELLQPRLEYHALPMEKPLKPIAIPLRPTDADVVLDLQPLVEQAYERGRYDLTDYKTRLRPPLSYAEQAFLEQRLQQRS